MAQDQEVLDSSLTTAISKAVETHKEEIQQDRSDVKVGEEDKSEAAEEDKKESEVDLDAENGRVLIRALRDPNQAGAVIDFLATQAGYTKGTIQTKQDVKEAKQDITTILEKNLGDDFKFLAPKLAPAIKETLEAMLAENDTSSHLLERIERQELKDIQNETAATHTSLANEWFGSDNMPNNVVQAMSAAMDEFPPTDPNMSPERYYRRIFQLVSGELGLTKKGSRNSGDRIERNRQDSAARNLSSQNRGVTPNLSGNPRKLSLKDAVSLAVEQVNQSSKK